MINLISIKLRFCVWYSVFCIFISLDEVAAQYFRNCNVTYHIDPGYSYLTSQSWPYYAPADSSCLINLYADVGYQIRIRCYIRMNGNLRQCSNSYFYVSEYGDLRRNYQTYCGRRQVYATSKYRNLTIAHIARNRVRYACDIYSARPAQCDCGWSNGVSTQGSKIVNGVDAGANEFPSAAAIDNKITGNILCGASIVSERYLVTAAHCFDNADPENHFVHVGSTNNSANGGQRINISRVIIHPDYSANTSLNDIALIELENPIEFYTNVGPICLLPQNTTNTIGQTVKVIGWGSQSFGGPTSETLKETNLTIVNNEDCVTAFPNKQITNKQICTYDTTDSGKDSCQGDSGGPLIGFQDITQTLRGIVSFGGPCGAGDSPAVNTDASSYTDWIYANAQQTPCRKLF